MDKDNILDYLESIQEDIYFGKNVKAYNQINFLTVQIKRDIENDKQTQQGKKDKQTGGERMNNSILKKSLQVIFLVTCLIIIDSLMIPNLKSQIQICNEYEDQGYVNPDNVNLYHIDCLKDIKTKSFDKDCMDDHMVELDDYYKRCADFGYLHYAIIFTFIINGAFFFFLSITIADLIKQITDFIKQQGEKE